MTSPDHKYPIPAFQLPSPGNRSPLTKQKPPPKRPVALPQKGFNRPSRLSSNLPALHPHQIKETPRYHKIKKNMRILKRFHHRDFMVFKEFIMEGLQCLIVDIWWNFAAAVYAITSSSRQFKLGMIKERFLLFSGNKKLLMWLLLNGFRGRQVVSDKYFETVLHTMQNSLLFDHVKNYCVIKYRIMISPLCF